MNPLIDLPANTKAHDPLLILSSDVVAEIFLYIPYHERLLLRTVCKTWNSILLSIRPIWQCIDFRGAKRPVRLSEVRQCAEYADGILQGLYLENFLMTESAQCVDVLLNIADSHPGSLHHLELNCHAPSFIPDHAFLSDARWTTLLNLTSLKMVLDRTPPFVNDVLSQRVFPHLRDLVFFADQLTHIETLSIYYNIKVPQEKESKPLPNLLRFTIGSRIYEPQHQYRLRGTPDFSNGEEFTVMIVDKSLNDLLSLMPNLEKFSAGRITSYRGSLDPVRLDMSQHDRLQYIDFSHCYLGFAPITPKCCKTLILRSTDVSCRTTLLDSVSAKMRYEHSLTSEDPFDIDTEEYSSVEKLDLSGDIGMRNMDFVKTIARFNPDKLKDVSIRLIWKWLDFHDVLTEEIPAPWRLSDPNSTIADYMVQYLPNLTRLDLSCTRVTDQSMKKLRNLTKVEYLDVSGTRISLQGVYELLQPYIKSENFSGMGAWRACTDSWYSSSKLKTIVLKRCKNMAAEDMVWLERNRINTGLYMHDYPAWDHLDHWRVESLNY